MTTETLTLTDTGQQLLRYLAAKYPERAKVDLLERDGIIQENGLTDDDFGTWFRSKWWSVPVVLFIAVVTVTGGFISVIKTLIELLSQ